MNVREGMRRLGLVVGVLGGMAGTFAAYSQSQPLLAQRAKYNAFQTLVSSPTMKKEIEILRTRIRDILKGLPPGLTPVPAPSDVIPANAGGDWFQQNAPKENPSQRDSKEGDDGDLVEALYGSTHGWKINRRGVRAIYFWGSTDEGKMVSRLAGTITAADIAEIETDDGQIVYSTYPPSLWSYLFLLTFPVLGFLVPWGTVKTLTWIGVGFSAGETR
jgi:hypothetical protein